MLVRAGVGLGIFGSVVVGGAVAGIGVGGFGWWLWSIGRGIVHGNPNSVVARVPLHPGARVSVRRRHLPKAELRRERGGESWELGVRHIGGTTWLSGEAALRGAGLLLPQINRFGGKAQQVQSAVRLLEQVDTPSRYFSIVGGSRSGETIARFPEEIRLALEMAAHEESERRALEGQLAQLEEAWREAEEIAGIADNMFLPSSVESALRRLRDGVVRGKE